MNTVINREAGDKAKGPRLQRLRCISLVLDAIANSSNPYIYAAVEHKDDVFVKNVEHGRDYLEQNKNFEETTSFTFNSPDVINTIIGFCDMWVEYGVKSKEVFLGFYATNQIGKENATTRSKSLGVVFPDKPILELLKSKEFNCPLLLPTVKALLLEEYHQQYKDKKETGNLSILKSYTDEDWKKFLNRIDWNFGDLDEEETQKVVLEKIKGCRYYSHHCAGKEESILRSLMDLLDEKQCQTDLLAKFTSIPEVELIFAKSASGNNAQIDDPIYEIWDKLTAPEDKRTILDKIKDVCSEVNPKTLQTFARKASGGRILQDANSSDKSFLSLRYRIYDKCAADLESYLQAIDKSSWASEAEIEKLFKFLYQQAKTHISEIGKEFRYTLKSEPVIEGIILELFDSCYLSMDAV